MDNIIVKVKCACGRVYDYTRQDRKGHSRTKCNSCMVNGRRERTKAWAVAYKGGKCQDCGYNKCLRALGFHHKDSKKKHFEINASNASRSSIVLKRELDKCDLVCANCHAERHDVEDRAVKSARSERP